MRSRAAAATTLVIPDLHAPYHDQEALAVVCAVARSLRPSRAVILGDVVDCYSVSRYVKSPQRRAHLAEELEEAGPALDLLAASLPSEVHFLQGNHEVRLEDLVASKVPELWGIVRNVRELLQIQERGWSWTPYQQSLRLGKMLYSHDFGRSGKNAAAQSLQDVGMSCCFGHTHRLAVAYQGEVKGSSHVALNAGHLADVRRVDYQHRNRALRDWQLGFGVVDEDDRGNVWVQAVPIVKGAAVVHGRRITP